MKKLVATLVVAIAACTAVAVGRTAELPGPQGADAEIHLFVPATKRVLADGETTYRGDCYKAWFKAMESAGWQVESLNFEDAEVCKRLSAMTALELLARYDVIAILSHHAATTMAMFPALEEFVRQGGGLVVVQTSQYETWFQQPINEMLPITVFRQGDGWHTELAARSYHLARVGSHPITEGIDWSECPPLAMLAPTWTPDSEMLRGCLMMVAPRETIVKGLINTRWQEILRADDLEHRSAAVVGQYGRGRVFVFGGWLGMAEYRDGMTDFVHWSGSARLWRNALRWLSEPGKAIRGVRPIWVAGGLDDRRGLRRTVSYALEEFGLRCASGPADAQGALITLADPKNQQAHPGGVIPVEPPKIEPQQEAALGALIEAGKPVLVLDHDQLAGKLAKWSPLAAASAGPKNQTFRTQHISIRWTGRIEPRFSETYTFYLPVDDGARLWIDDKLLVDDWTRHAVAERIAKIDLTAGRKYRLKLEYFNYDEGGTLRLLWSSPSQPKELVPKECLSPRPPRTGKGLLAEYYLGDNFNELFLRRRDEKIEFHTANDMTDYQTHLLKIGSPAAPPGKLPQREKVSFLPLETPLTDSAVQPPGQWKFRAWQIETSPRDLTERWFASDYDDAAWEIRTPGDLAQTIGGAQAGCIGSTWYRAVVQLPAGMPPTLGWAIESHKRRSYMAQVRVWVDGREVGVERFADSDQRYGRFLRLAALGAGRHVLAMRFYSAGDPGNQPLGNYGLAKVTAETRPLPPPPPAVKPAADLADWGDYAAHHYQDPQRPMLYYGRQDGDRDFRLVFQLEEETARRTPLLVFNEPGLIRQVTVNGKRLARIPEGCWDGNPVAPNSTFLLRGVLKEGENIVQFHPDFTRLEGEDYPVTAETPAGCEAPYLEFTGERQALVAEDPSLASYIPQRLFMPGETLAARSDAKVLLRWHDGRPALVQRGNVIAWTSNMNPLERPGTLLGGQFNSAVKQEWYESWENSWYSEYQVPSGPREPVTWHPRPDSIVCENLAPLLAAVLARQAPGDQPQILAIRRNGRMLTVVVANPGPARKVLLSHRLFDWQGSFLANRAEVVSLPGGGNAAFTIAVPRPVAPFEGDALKEECLLRIGVRSEDNAVGYDYREKVFDLSGQLPYDAALDLPPGLAISIATDSIYDRLKSKSLPERLPETPGYRARHLWWPLLREDPGAMVYLSGETAHISVSVANQSEQSVSLPVIIDFFAQGRGQRERRVERSAVIAPRGRWTETIQHQVRGVFEPYRVQVRIGGKEGPSKCGFFYVIQPWKRNFCIDASPTFDYFSFASHQPFVAWMQPDNVQAKRPFDRGDGEWFRTEEWYVQNRTGAVGNGGGYNEFTGESCGFGWGPFFTSNYYCPDQMGLMPNGQPVLHYVADGLRMRAFPEPVRTEVADFWANYWVQARWNSLANFREWLAVNDPAAGARFTPQTLAEARAMVAGPLAREYDRWQTAVIIGGWGAARAAFPAGSQLWSQAEVCGVASDRGAPATELVRFLARRDAAADIDPGASRVGMGFRYRAYLEGTTAALAPDDVHFNATCIRHMYNTNDQRMRNMGNCTPETFRAFASETVWGAAVRPDGTLRSILDTPYSELEIGAATGLNAGNRIYNQTYRLGAFVEPERALGLLWVAVGERETRLSSRQVFETLRDSGVPLGAMISPRLLSVAPQSGAAGVVFLLPPSVADKTLADLRSLAAKGMPVVCLIPPQCETIRTRLPKGVEAIDLRCWKPNDANVYFLDYTPQTARELAARIVRATGNPVDAGEGTAVYGFRARGRAFIVVQNLWREPRTATLTVRLVRSAPPGTVVAVNLNDNGRLPCNSTEGVARVAVPLGRWDATLVMVRPSGVE